MKEQKFCRNCRWFLYPEASAGNPDMIVTYNCPYSYHRVGPGKYDGYTTGGREACDHYQEAVQMSIIF